MSPYAPQHLICIGQNIHLEKSGYNISELYISPGNQLLVLLDANTCCDDLVWQEVSNWDYDMLNEICEEYTFATTGQSYMLTDLLVKYNLATFSSVPEMVEVCKDTIKTKVQVASKIIPENDFGSSSNSITSFIKRYAEIGGLAADNLIEFVFGLEMTNRLSVHAVNDRLEIRFLVGNARYCPLLTLLCATNSVSAIFTPSALCDALEAENLFSANTRDFLNRYASYIDISRSGTACFWDITKTYFMDLEKIATNWYSISKLINALAHSIT